MGRGYRGIPCYFIPAWHSWGVAILLMVVDPESEAVNRMHTEKSGVGSFSFFIHQHISFHVTDHHFIQDVYDILIRSLVGLIRITSSSASP